MAITEEYHSEAQKVTAVNISERGMHYIRPTDSHTRSGKEVILTFSLLSSSQPIKVSSWVVKERQLSGKIATHVTFLFMSESEEQLIRDFVASENCIWSN